MTNLGYNGIMDNKKYKQKDSVIVVFTGDNKGKTSAALGMMSRALGTGWKVAFVQFIKSWDVGEHKFIADIMPIYPGRLTFHKGGLGFFEAGELSAKASKEEHIKQAKKTYEFAYNLAGDGEHQLVICDEINNAVHDGLLSLSDLRKLIKDKHPKTSLCLTGRNFPKSLVKSADIVTDMAKIKHHYDDNFIANKGIDY